MVVKFLNILMCSLFLVACATNKELASTNENLVQTRSIAVAGKCEDLFNSKLQLHIVNNNTLKKDKKAVHEVTFELVNEVMPKSINDTFWKVVEQLARNEDTKIRLNTNSMTLTKPVNENLQLHSTYMYDPNTDIFILKKIEYTEKNRNTVLVSSEPLYKESQKLREDLAIQLSELSLGSQDQVIGIPGYISHTIYKKIESEMKNLNLFTTHELLKISQLSPKTRMARYQFLLASRKTKNFIVQDFMVELIKKPIKAIVISVMSIAILSHTEFLKNIVSIKNETPEWVAPSVVKMAGRYAESTQGELVHLMKDINNNKNAVKIFEKNFEAKKKLVNIDDVDQFTVQIDPIHHKTYFVMNHENQNGTMDIYSVEIDPTKYPELLKQAQVASPEPRTQADAKE
jgi:predicted transcriptional regulator with HTH domain